MTTNNVVYLDAYRLKRKTIPTTEDTHTKETKQEAERKRINRSIIRELKTKKPS